MRPLETCKNVDIPEGSIVEALPSHRFYWMDRGVLHPVPRDVIVGTQIRTVTVSDEQLAVCRIGPPLVLKESFANPGPRCSALAKFPDSTNEVVRSMPSGRIWRRQGDILYPFHSEDAARSRGYTIVKTPVSDREVDACKTFWKPYSAVCPFPLVPDQSYVKALPSGTHYVRDGNTFVKLPSPDAMPVKNPIEVADRTMQNCPRGKVRSFNALCPLTTIPDKTYVKATPSGAFYLRNGWTLYKYADAQVLASQGVQPNSVTITLSDKTIETCPPAVIQEMDAVVRQGPSLANTTSTTACGATQIPDGSVIQGSRAIYLKEGGKLRLYPTLEVYASYNRPNVTHRLSTDAIAACPKGPDLIRNLIQDIPDRGFVKAVPSGTYYMRNANLLYKFADATLLSAYGFNAQATTPTQSDETMALLPQKNIVIAPARSCDASTLPDGAVVQGSRAIYRKEGGKLRLFPSSEIYKSWDPKVTIRYTDDALATCPRGPDIGMNPCNIFQIPENGILQNTSTGTLYKKVDGVLRPFSASLYAAWGSPAVEYKLPEAQLEACTVGALVDPPPVDPSTLPDGATLETVTKKLYRKEGGIFRSIPSLDSLVVHEFPLPATKGVLDSLMAKLPQGAPYPAPTIDDYLGKIPDPAVLVLPSGTHALRRGSKLVYANKTTLDDVPAYKSLPRVPMSHELWSQAKRYLNIYAPIDGKDHYLNNICSATGRKKFKDFTTGKEYILMSEAGTKVPGAGTYRVYNQAQDARHMLELNDGMAGVMHVDGEGLQHYCNFNPSMDYCTLDDADMNFERPISSTNPTRVRLYQDTLRKLDTSNTLYKVDTSTKRYVPYTPQPGESYTSFPFFNDAKDVINVCVRR